jgi:predicted extracellular nuclease
MRKFKKTHQGKKSTTYVFRTNCDILDHIILNSLEF